MNIHVYIIPGEGTVVTVDPDEWLHYANEEVEKGKVCKAVREKGMDTIFCLDMSESMKGAGWDQAVNFIRKFIEGKSTCFNIFF
jgi:hypothetical protein